MFDTTTEIMRQLRAGEDSRAEFKRVVFGGRGVRSPNAEDMAGEMVAFANDDGGVIFLGVDDDGIVRSLPEDQLGHVESWIVNVASNNWVQPGPDPMIELVP